MNASAQDVAATFKALSHPARVRLLRLAAQQERSGEELAELLNLSAATVSHHLAQLDNAGLVLGVQRGHHRFYQVAERAFTPSLSEVLGLGAPDSPAAPEPTAEERYRRKVLTTFMKDGVLSAIPAQRKKRDVILEVLQGKFAVERRYPEREVNEVLLAVHPDFFTLRRELVERGLLTRERGVYWRPEVGEPLL